ncbi:MAG: trans-2-enoyl-CoA reductase family protein [Puniceicoccales bacterium]|jgi:enoyl-[acyl-carrier protein] reductase/trans-2-enoyl-CoA reductase (NAD+)|nr:trans-2-enoyl-CoA reductase family protein [Puniceicoccales bacterium]
MAKAIIDPKIKGFICTTAHPIGCAANVLEQVRRTEADGPIAGGPRGVLVIGASTGYGLASRIVAAFGAGAHTVGVFFERPAEGARTASAGWYNAVSFESLAKKRGLRAPSINGDAFSDEIKGRTIDCIRRELGKVDLVIYSLASPRRTDPKTGEIHRSALKPIGQPFTGKTVNTDRGLVHEVTLEPASEEEIRGTVAVMGGDDWKLWMQALLEGNVLAKGARTVAYSYIGPQLTWPIYRDGTIGRAKADLDGAVGEIDKLLTSVGGRAHIAVNKAVVTQASSAIPVVPLYISLLFKVMKEKGIHEGCVQQMGRLFRERLYGKELLPGAVDGLGRLRIDDLEMQPDVQKAVENLWPRITSENLRELSDFDGYAAEFLQLFGFGVEGVDYEAPVEMAKALEDLR